MPTIAINMPMPSIPSISQEKKPANMRSNKGKKGKRKYVKKNTKYWESKKKK